MMEFRKTLTPQEIEKGVLRWDDSQDRLMRRILPQTLVFDMLFDGKRLDQLSVEWEKREIFIGEPLKKALAGSEVAIFSPTDKANPVVVGKLIDPGEKIMIRKRLSHVEHKNRVLKWYAREDDLYRRLLPRSGTYFIEVGGRRQPGVPPNFEKRTLAIGEALRVFSPGDHLLIRWAPDAEVPTLTISREEMPASIATDAMTSLRSMVARLLSRPLSEFNEGEVKGLIVLLDENKNLWERLNQVNQENQKLKEQIATLESVFEQFSRNSFFACKKDFQDWVASHLHLFEKGIRLLHRDYRLTGPDGLPLNLDLLCQDRKGILVAVEILFQPAPDELAEAFRRLDHAASGLDALAQDLSGGKLKATSIRGMIITNRERTELVEQCLQKGYKLCVVNSGCVIDVLE